MSSCRTPCGPGLESGYHIDASGPVIKEPDGAILIARAMWYSLRPDRDKRSEAEWLEFYAATLEKGVWRVYMSAPALGGGTQFKLDARDAVARGRLLCCGADRAAGEGSDDRGRDEEEPCAMHRRASSRRARQLRRFSPALWRQFPTVVVAN